MRKNELSYITVRTRWMWLMRYSIDGKCSNAAACGTAVRSPLRTSNLMLISILSTLVAENPPERSLFAQPYGVSLALWDATQHFPLWAGTLLSLYLCSPFPPEAQNNMTRLHLRYLFSLAAVAGGTHNDMQHRSERASAYNASHIDRWSTKLLIIGPSMWGQAATDSPSVFERIRSDTT